MTSKTLSTDALTTAAVRLSDVLQAENMALLALDYATAGRLLADKRAATAELNAAQAGALFAPDGLQALALRLNALADENKTLLERAIIVQRRVLGTVAQATQAAAPEPQYGPAGSTLAVRAIPVALRANA